MFLRCLPSLFLASLTLAQEAPKTAAKTSPLPALQPASAQMEPGAPEVVPGGFTIAILPDTQFYAQLHPEIFHRQTQWLADNATKYGIRFAIQVGDVTETSADAEWTVARDAFKRLDGKVPWASAPGNHDYGGKLQINTHRTPFSVWLPLPMFRAMPTFGGSYDEEQRKVDNHWHQFEAGDRKWLVIGLEFAPRADVLRWTNDVIAAHPKHGVILFTHAYLDPRTNERIKLSASMGKAKADEPAPAEKPDTTQPEDLWQMASQHANVVMILSGHACYTNHRTSTAKTGQTVQEMVVDYQKDVNGGNGWLRLLQVLPDGKTVRCQDYSPLLNQRCTLPDRTFDFELAMPGQ
ncbi:metallophosphoesterase [Prosthecobacter sp.]|uniref:metallophosphoesterase n=1 Tax=Prosthecobacter sp. TaxID=1965333 RepID=UPI001DE29721|nr:metallophosphoesterase [Prosthecobacter sp.]MCB1279123.1 metallophosphoesterase [Prosthecobacter sp.]